MMEAILSRRFAGAKPLFSAKGKAAGIHVAISLAIFFVLSYLIVFKWYPQPYFAADGGWQGLRIMFGVDVVLGPLLTFIVFNPRKRRREIATDLSLIGLLQLSALVWGIQIVHGQRPAAIVEFDGTFSSALAHGFENQKFDLAQLKRFDDRQPPIIFQRLPEGDETRESFRLANDGVARPAQVFLYQRFDQSLTQVFAHAAAYESKITASRPALKGEFQRLREKRGTDVGFLPFKGRYGDIVLVLSRRGEIVDSLKL